MLYPLSHTAVANYLIFMLAPKFKKHLVSHRGRIRIWSLGAIVPLAARTGSWFGEGVTKAPRWGAQEYGGYRMQDPLLFCFCFCLADETVFILLLSLRKSFCYPD